MLHQVRTQGATAGEYHIVVLCLDEGGVVGAAYVCLFKDCICIASAATFTLLTLV